MAGSLPRNRGNRSRSRTGATVSRRLRAAGFNIASSDRRFMSNCATVSAAGDYVSVLVDYGIPDKSDRVAVEIMTQVTGWPQVSALQVEGDTQTGWVLVSFTYTPLARRTK